MGYALPFSWLLSLKTRKEPEETEGKWGSCMDSMDWRSLAMETTSIELSEVSLWLSSELYEENMGK